MAKIKWRWKPKRWWLTLIGIFILYQIILTGILFLISDDPFSDPLKFNNELAVEIDTTIINYYNILFLGVIIWWGVNDRSWKTVPKIFWIIGLMFSKGFLAPLIAWSGLVGHSTIGLTNFKLYFLASIPLYIIAMRRSAIFVEEDIGPGENNKSPEE